MNLWRHELCWIAGMGIIIFAVAILPILGIGGMQLYMAESPGTVKESDLPPRIAQTAKALWMVYAGIHGGLYYRFKPGRNELVRCNLSCIFRNESRRVFLHMTAVLDFSIRCLLRWYLQFSNCWRLLIFVTDFVALRKQSFKPYIDDRRS